MLYLILIIGRQLNQIISVDNPITSTEITLKYCGASIQMYCNNKYTYIYKNKALLSLEQPYLIL
jgi:hypothetical protein